MRGLLLIVVAAAARPLPVVPLAGTRAGRIVSVRLNVTVTRTEGIPISFTRRSFNGMEVGPTIRVRRGDTLRVLLDNQLGTESITATGERYWKKQALNKTGDWDHDRDVYSHPNYTNIHLHGMHVSPIGTSDNVYRQCAPQTQLSYEYKIPEDHASGTFWYHPHRDQSSALQLASGMVGAFIVEDDPATLPPALQAMEEVVMVLHEVSHSNMPTGGQNFICFFCFDDFAWPSGDQLPLNKVFNDPEYQKCHPFGAPPGTKRDFAQMTQPFDCAFLLINGAYQPEVPLTAGVWQRWRVVQSSHASMLRMSAPVVGCEMWLLASDGAYLNAPRQLAKPLVLPAGARADIAVRCSAAGRFDISALHGGFHTRGKIIETYEPTIYPRSIATLVVTASDDNLDDNLATGPLPPDLPPRPAAMRDLRQAHVDETFTVTYNLTGGGANGGLIAQFGNGGEFKINGVSYRGRPEHCITLNTIQEWTIVSGHNILERWMHSFHIHVNNFQVMSVDEGAAGQMMLDDAVGDWRDTVVVPVNGKVVIRMNVTDFIGRFPFHCHVTAHQDVGMMQMVEVNETCAAAPNAVA